MTVLTSPPKMMCCYRNSTAQFQIIRISNIPHWFFERTVMPNSSITFEAVYDAQLEVHTGVMMSAILSDTIPCEQLIPQKHPTHPAEQWLLQSA